MFWRLAPGASAGRPAVKLRVGHVTQVRGVR